MPKRKKPDAAERIAELYMATPGWRGMLATAIRRAISAAVRADRKARRGKP